MDKEKETRRRFVKRSVQLRNPFWLQTFVRSRSRGETQFASIGLEGR